MDAVGSTAGYVMQTPQHTHCDSHKDVHNLSCRPEICPSTGLRGTFGSPIGIEQGNETQPGMMDSYQSALIAIPPNLHEQPPTLKLL